MVFQPKLEKVDRQTGKRADRQVYKRAASMESEKVCILLHVAGERVDYCERPKNLTLSTTAKTMWRPITPARSTAASLRC